MSWLLSNLLVLIAVVVVVMVAVVDVLALSVVDASVVVSYLAR